MTRARVCRMIMLAAVAVPGVASEASAASLPEWAEAIAQAAPEIGGTISENPSRVLLSETRVLVQDDGKLRVRRRRAAQALRSDAADVGLGYFNFDDRTKILRTRAWHLPPKGSAKKTRSRGALDLSLDSSFLSDAKTRLLPVEGIEKGSLVFFEFEFEEQPYELAYPIILQEGAPTALIRVTAQLPDGWRIRHVWLKGENLPASSDGNVHSWELRDLPAPAQEPLGPTLIQDAPSLLLNFEPPPDRPLAVDAFKDWSQLVQWIEELVEGRDEVTPEIETAAREALAAGETTVVPRVRAAGAWVRDRVRYVAIELGISGYRPRYASEVLANLYGDCKDKATLLSAILKTAGIRSYPILINATRPDTVAEEIPCLAAFDHYILGVPIPEAEVVPEDVAPAIVEAGELGRLLIVDATDETVSVGHLSADLSGKTVLVVAGDRSRLLQLPITPSAHRVERVMDAEIATDLSVKAHLTTALYGEPARRWRSVYRSSERDYEEQTEKELRSTWPAATLDKLVVTEEASDGAFIETLDVRIPPPVDRDAAALLRLFPGALNPLPRVTLGRREKAVLYPYPLTLRYTTTVRGTPAGQAAPRSEERDGEGWWARSHVRQEDNVVHGSFELELQRQRFEPDAFRDLRRLWSGARRAASPAVSLTEP